LNLQKVRQSEFHNMEDRPASIIDFGICDCETKKAKLIRLQQFMYKRLSV